MSHEQNDKELEFFLDENNRQTYAFVKSNTLQEARYNRLMQTLVITFKGSSGSYSYFDVPTDIAEGLFKCETMQESAGKYFVKHIKHNYPYKKIT